MNKPVMMAVDADVAKLQALKEELHKRYSADYEVICERSAGTALQTLEAFKQAGRPVALLFTEQSMPELTGLEFLDRANALHPHAKRILLADMWDRTDNEAILQAMTFGWIDSYVMKPAGSLDERFHSQVSALLMAWCNQNMPQPAVIKVIGERWSARAHEFRDLLDRYDMPYGFYEVDSEEGQALLQQVGRTEGPFPVGILYDGRVLANPSNEEVARAFDTREGVEGGLYDLAIIGGGPAGLSAAVYGASEGLRTILVERAAPGGQASTSSRIRNYLGFPIGISGVELARRAYDQARLFGTEFYLFREAHELLSDGNRRIIRLSNGVEITTRTVVLAMGAAYRRLGIPALEALIGAGVFYGGTITEARAMRGQQVFIAGAGNSAGQAAVHLAKYAQRVTILVRGSSLAASMSAYLIKEIEATDTIDVRLNTQIVDGNGAGRLESLVLQTTPTGETQTVPASALFIFIGAEPHTHWLPSTIVRDDQDFILTGADLLQDGRLADIWPLARSPFLLETSMPGVFAVGDVRCRSVKRVASAVGESSIAIQQIHDYLPEE